MTNREVKKDKMGDDPPYLAVGTDVSAKYKGAFCEAKVRKVVRVVKCKVHMKNGGVAFVTDDQIKGNLRIGTPVEVKLPDKKEYAEASITSIKDLSQYTVVFDDGDITTLRRTALCLKSGRHFAESETLDQLPLTHPEHFSTPVIGASRRGRRRLGGNEDSSDEEGSSVGGGGGRGERQREADIGKVVCVEISEKKKVKDNWFPGLIVAPNAQDAVRIHVDEDYLVRSFKDGRYFTVPKKEATEFTREIGLRVDNPSLKLAVEKALVFLDKDELPPHWDRDLLFGLVDSDMEDDDDQLDSDSSDDEPREEKDHFVAQLYKFMDDRGTPINKGPVIQSRDVDLYRLFRVVHKLGGYNRVTNQNQWKLVTHKMNFGTGANTVNSVKHAYKKFLHSFEDFYRKLGCTMVNHPRSHRRPNSKSNRSLIRDRDRATPLMKESSSGCPSSSGVPASSGEANASRDMMDVKVEMKKEEVDDPSESRTSRKDTSVSRVSVNRDKPPGGFEAKRDRHVKEEAQRRERTRDKTCKDTGKDAKDIKDVKDIKDETIVPPVKKKVEETSKLKVDERPPKSSIGILAKFSYKKDKAGLNRDNEEKEKNRMNRVKKSLGKGSGLMERQKRTIKDTVKALAKTLGFGGKAAGNSIIGGVAASSTSTRKMSASTTTSGSGEDDDRKKPKEEVAVAPSVEKKRGSSGTRSSREDTVAAVAPVTTTPSHPPQPSTPPAPPPARKSSLSGEDRRSHSRASRSRRPEDEGSMEPVSVSSNPGETSDGLTLDIVSPHKWISVGDKLRVYYGPNHKSKVTYEAKVVATRQEGEGGEREYLVHYTGWNTRYDEWIRRNRIAENLAWNTPSGVSTGPPQQQQQAKEACSPGIHGGSSRNKSTPRRSSTRTSTRNTRANTDDSDSDKESDGGSESETEANSSSQNRSMRSRRILSDEEKKPALPSPGTKTRSNKKCKTDEEEEDVEKGKEKQEEEEDKKKLPLPEAERKSLRLSQRKKQEVEHEKRLGPESDSGSDSESQEDSKAKVLELIEPLDDVYEFKEPEPFTFSKQKKTISPPGPAVQKGKKNIGLFEDYDNLEEENEDINAAIQRVMDTCDENKMDLDLLDSNSSDSNSSDSNSMCEIMKKRLQSEINTYEGPKSKLKGKGEESPTPPMRTRRSSESKSGKLENKNGEEKGKLLVLRSKEEKVLDETPVEKLSEPVNCGPDSSLAATRSKKPDVDNPPRSKKIEFETSASSGKVKKPEIDTTSGNKSKKTADLESIPNPKVKKSLDIDTSSLKAKKSELENISTPKTKKSDADTNIITSPKSKKSDTGTVSCAKVKKSDSDNPILIGGKAKKSESDVSNKTKKSDISVVASAKAKKIDLETASSPKAKKSEVDINESSPGKVNKKLETPETNMKTRLKTESRCSSPGSKTRSKTELASSKTDLTLNKNESMLKEEVMEALSETNTEDNKQSESPLPSVKQEKPKPTVLESKPKVSLASKKPVLEVKLQNSSKAADPVALATKVSDNVEATILAVSSLITPAPPAISHSKPISNSEGDNSAAGLTKLSPALEPKKQDVLFSSSKTTPKTKLKVIPSLSLHKSHTDFSAQTDPLDVNKDKNILAPNCLPKLPDIPVLQRIDCVVPKTPIKREPIDPTKIDLIKVSPNMPQLEKIDTMDVVDIATPVKIEEKIEERSDLKFPPFQFEDVPETPEKIFLPAVDSESEVIVKPDTVAKPDKKIEFKMKPKTSSPSGFGKTERARKLVRQRLGEAESPTKTVGGKDKKPSQTTPQVKKYGPASKPDTSTSTDAVKTNIKPNANTDVETKDNPPVVVSKSKETSLLLVGKTQESPAIVAAKVTETSPVSSKNKDVPSSLSNKAKESSPILSIKNKETTTPVSTKGDDNTVSSPSRVKDTSPSLSVKIKDSPSPPVQIKNKDGSVIVSTKVKDYPAVVPNKNKDVLLVASKSKESTPICSSKCRASTPVLSSRTKESDLVQPTIVSSKGNENMDVPTKPEPSLLTLEIDTKPRDTTSSPSKGKLTADVKKTEVVEIKYEPEPIIDPKKEDTKKQKEELKLSNVLEANIKVEESTPTGTNKSSDPHTSEEADQSKTPEKGKEDVEKGKRKEDSDEDAAKREEKSKELSSVFEFDETLEDEIVDLESESYLAPSKRKLAALIDSPGSEFMSNKLAKLNELEKLKQKLFMDCSGEGEDLEEKVEVEDKSRTEAEGRPENVQLELTADESLEEEVDNTLLCKETIPGSPTPYQDELNMIMELPPTNSSSGASSSSSTANAVLDNTPPTTPESSLSPPRNDCPVVSSGSGVYAKMMLGGEDREEVGAESLKKGLTTPMKRRSSHTERSLKKRVKQSPRNPGAGSDSDDLSMSEPFSIFSPTTTDITKSKYSYFVELDPELDQAQRIAVVQQKLQDLRKEYMMYKQELVTIDRRRKKIRRRERENKKNNPPALPVTLPST